MSNTDVLNLIRESLIEVAPGRKGEFEGVTLDASMASLQLGSIAVMEMIGNMEDRLGVVFEEDQLNRVRCLNDLATLVNRAAA